MTTAQQSQEPRATQLRWLCGLSERLTEGPPPECSPEHRRDLGCRWLPAYESKGIDEPRT